MVYKRYITAKLKVSIVFTDMLRCIYYVSMKKYIQTLILASTGTTREGRGEYNASGECTYPAHWL